MARVLLGVTGGIAAYKAAPLVRLLRARGHQVRCALSRAAAQFVSPLTLEVLSAESVFEEQYLSVNGSGEELHITAAEWADVVCIAPATAHCLVRIAGGFADDFLTTMLLAYSGPLVVAPAMHSHMWTKPTTQANIAMLRERGVEIVGPDVGLLANNELGIGRMSDLSQIADAIKRAVVNQDYQGLAVVVTAGPTYEAVDPVRFLGNRSSGRMGFAVAEAAAQRGAQVELIAGPCALDTPSLVHRRDVNSAIEMRSALEDCGVATADLVVMCAAVADYRPQTVAEAKIKRRDQPELSLELVANPDLLEGLARLAAGAVRVGFAAETEELEDHARFKLSAKGVHFLCANDVSRSDIGFDAGDNQLIVLGDDGSRVELKKAPKIEIADQLLDLFRERVLAARVQSQPVDDNPEPDSPQPDSEKAG